MVFLTSSSSQVIYEERAIEVPEVIHVEAVTQVPRPHVQFIKKEVSQGRSSRFMLQCGQLADDIKRCI